MALESPSSNLSPTQALLSQIRVSEVPVLSAANFSSSPISRWALVPIESSHELLKGIRQILTGQSLEAAPFAFNVAGAGAEHSTSSGLESILNKSYQIVEERGIHTIAHHAEHLIGAACNLIFKSTIGDSLTHCLCSVPSLSLESPLEDILMVLDSGSYPSPNLEDVKSLTQAVETLIQASRFRTTPERVAVARALGRLKIEIDRLVSDPEIRQKLAPEVQKSFELLDNRLPAFPSPMDFIVRMNADSIFRERENHSSAERLSSVLALLSEFVQSLRVESDLIDKSKWIKESHTRIVNASHLQTKTTNGDRLNYFPRINLLELNIEPDFVATFKNLVRDPSENLPSPAMVMIGIDFGALTIDNALLLENPCFFIHRRATTMPSAKLMDPADPLRYDPPPKGYRFYFHAPSKEAFYIRDADLGLSEKSDTALKSPLIDLYNPFARRRIIERVLNLISITNSSDSPAINALCVKSVTPWLTDIYQNELRGSGYPNYQPKPTKEFLAELISTVKEYFPEVAFATFENQQPDRAWLLGFDAVIADPINHDQQLSLEARGFNFIKVNSSEEDASPPALIVPVINTRLDFEEKEKLFRKDLKPTPYSK
jgi:hypothetical protein